jgi:hypothetical protein
MTSLRVFFTPVPSNLGTRCSEQTDLSHFWRRFVVFLSSHFGGKACICLVDLSIKRSLGCPITGVALHIANILLHFLSQVFRLSPSIFRKVLKKFCFLLCLLPTVDNFCVWSMLVDKEMLMHQLYVRLLSEGEGGGSHPLNHSIRRAPEHAWFF